MLLVLLASGVLCGILAANLAVPADPWPLALAAAAALLGAVLLRRPRGLRVVALVVCAAALGALRVSLAAPADPDPLAAFHDLRVELAGTVHSTPALTERSSRFVLGVERVGAAPVQARVLVVSDPDGPAARAGLGDRVLARGRLSVDGTPVAAAAPVPRTLVFPELEVTPVAAPPLLAVAARLRADAVHTIQAYLPEPEASLAAGVLLGGHGHVGAEFRGQLQRSGLAHIMAIDGYKQILVTAVLGALTVRVLGRRRAALPMLLGVLAYTVLTGARPSAVRAGLMVGSATLAGVVGRAPDSLTALALAAALMALVEPSLLFDIGYQLSFTATLGLIVLWPHLQRLFHGLPTFVADQVGVTTVVTIATLPVMLSVFQSISLVSPLAHVVAMPLLGPVLVLAALLALSGPLPPVAAAVAWLAWWPTALLAELVRLFGDVPGAALSTGHLPRELAVALGVALLAWAVLGLPELGRVRAAMRAAWRAHQRVLLPSAIVAASLGCGLVLLAARPEPQLLVEPLAVGRGSALFVRGPSGATAVIVGGRLDGRALVSQVGQRLPLWEHELEALVVHDEAAGAGLGALLERYPPRAQYEPGFEGRVTLGGAALDVYDRGVGLAVSYGQVWVRLQGRPPPPALAVTAVLGDAALRSDGARVWSAVDQELR